MYKNLYVKNEQNQQRTIPVMSTPISVEETNVEQMILQLC